MSPFRLPAEQEELMKYDDDIVASLGINDSTWYGIQVDNSTDVDNKAISFFLCVIFLPRGCA